MALLCTAFRRPVSPPPPHRLSALGSLFSNSSTRFFIHFTESSGTTAASEHTWGGEIGKLQTVNRVHFILLDHFGKGREQRQEAPRFKYSLLNRRETPGGRANCRAREVGGNLSACVPSPTLPAGGPGDSSWDYSSRASESVITRPSPLYPSLSAPLPAGVF